MPDASASNHYNALKAQIGELLAEGRRQAAKSVNTILVQTYWRIGHHIVEFEQQGQDRAEYGVALIDRLACDLTLHCLDN